MPADPLLNEKRILATLTDYGLMLTPMNVRSLMSLVLMCCYDRKVTRDFMADMIDHTAEVGIIMAELEGASKLLDMLKMLKTDVEPTEIHKAIELLCAQWAAKRKIVAEKFELVTQCPTSQDKVS